MAKPATVSRGHDVGEARAAGRQTSVDRERCEDWPKSGLAAFGRRGCGGDTFAGAASSFADLISARKALEYSRRLKVVPM